MSDQREIIDHLTKTLELLSVEKGKSQQTPVKKVNEARDGDLVHYSYSYINFSYENPTIYHAISYFSKALEEAGFKYLSEKQNWQEKLSKGSGGKFYTVRNGTNLSAFIVGKNWEQTKGLGAIGAHADSLTAKLKPITKKKNVEGFELLGVAPYGGTLNELWFDRDLGIGGRVLYKEKNSNAIQNTLINSAPHPIAKIPSLAPHFGAPAVPPFDKETQAVPVIGYSGDDAEEATEEEKCCPLYGKHSLHLLRYVAKLAGVEVSQLVQLDLDLFDVQKGSLGGIKNDFLFVPRIDDKICSYASLIAFIEFSRSIDVAELDTFTSLTLYDNEEIGSLSRQGAKGGLFEATVSRVVQALDDQSLDLHTLYANSIILSADVNHMFNPNFAEVYLEHHRPKPNVGVALSLDTNVHMATDVVGTTFVEELARLNGDKVQYFHIKNNSRSGGTIGPSIAAQTGARTIDLGIPQLSMHSIRATTGSKDVGLGVQFFRGFFKNWRPVLDQFGDL